jgi:hypothetical protein
MIMEFKVLTLWVGLCFLQKKKDLYFFYNVVNLGRRQYYKIALLKLNKSLYFGFSKKTIEFNIKRLNNVCSENS